jgi:UDP-glucose 4-epimerase
MKKILITGGGGFIGSHLAEKLLSLGHSVSLLDLSGCFSVYQKKKFNIYEIDIMNFFDLKKLPKFDIIYHLAAQVGTASSLKNVSHDLLCNSLGTLNIVEIASLMKVEKLIFSSSMAVYGENTDAIETDLCVPLSPYGISKSCAENYIKYSQRINADMQCVTFRIFNCYGPNQSTKNLTQGLASIFIEQIKNTTNLKVTGRLDRQRDLIYIEDVVSALVLPIYNRGVRGVFNLCSGKSTSICELIETIIKVSKKDRERFSIENIGGNFLDPHITTGNNQKLRKFGWLPKKDLESGLKICWEAK